MVQRLVALAAMLVCSALLAGCGGGDEPDPDPAGSASSTSPTQTPTASAPPTVPPTDGSSPGTVGELPESYPVEEVPLADGELGEVLENPGLNAYLVTIYPDTDFDTAFQQARERLEAVGFSQRGTVISAGPSSSTASWTNEDWEVLVTGGLPERITLQYTIHSR